MKSHARQAFCNDAGRRSTRRVVFACLSFLCAAVTNAATVRDNFEDRVWSNNDGPNTWSGDWIEVDGDEPPPSPTSGNARITHGGELRLDDRPNTGGDPSVAREANLDKFRKFLSSEGNVYSYWPAAIHRDLMKLDEIHSSFQGRAP